MQKVMVDAVGEQCPIPVVKAARALREMQEAGTLEIHVDNEIAVQNLMRMAAGHGVNARWEHTDEQKYVVTVEVTSPVGETPLEELEPACAPAGETGLLVAVDTDVMGRGSEELGRTLMKGFLYALTQLPRLPDRKSVV